MVTSAKKVQAEITYLNEKDLFWMLYRPNANFDYPLHFHSDFELNLVKIPGKGKRIVGDSVEEFDEIDLVLIGSNLPHAWDAPSHPANLVVNIKFHDWMLNSPILSTRIFTSIREMLGRAVQGILFSRKTAEKTEKRLADIHKSRGFSSAIDFIMLLYDLSVSGDQRTLAGTTYNSKAIIAKFDGQRIGKICKFIDENYSKLITLSDIAGLINMSDSAASHFFKKRTGRSFINYLNEVRVGKASAMLGETTISIAEIAYRCGFSSASHFNLIFRKYRDKTPNQFRNQVQKSIIQF
jgi:AraC-like DNA-binding protein